MNVYHEALCRPSQGGRVREPRQDQHVPSCAVVELCNKLAHANLKLKTYYHNTLNCLGNEEMREMYDSVTVPRGIGYFFAAYVFSRVSEQHEVDFVVLLKSQMEKDLALSLKISGFQSLELYH